LEYSLEHELRHVDPALVEFNRGEEPKYPFGLLGQRCNGGEEIAVPNISLNNIGRLDGAINKSKVGFGGVSCDVLEILPPKFDDFLFLILFFLWEGTVNPFLILIMLFYQTIVF
jgi:hypothetical protein